MKKLLCLMAGILLLHAIKAQNYTVEPYNIGDRVSDLPLKPLLNYKDTTAKLSSFGHKLIILDFWDIRCSDCIAMFPVEDSLQRLFAKDLQFILIAFDTAKDVRKFMGNWEKNHHMHLSLPIMTDAFRLSFKKMFLQYFLPHYVWLAPNGTMLAQTNSLSIDARTIKVMIQKIKAQEKKYRDHKLHEEVFHFPPLTSFQEQLIRQRKE